MNTGCKHLGHQINQGIWWCNRQFDKDFMKTLPPYGLTIISECDCKNCPYIEFGPFEIEWELVSEI